MSLGAIWPCDKCKRHVPFHELKAGLCWICQEGVI